MPEIGTKCLGKDLVPKKNPDYAPYVWTQCPICKCERWVQVYYLERATLPGICQKCASWRINAKKKQHPRPLEPKVDLSNHCSICKIIIGPDHEEKVPYSLNGTIVCGDCRQKNSNRRF